MESSASQPLEPNQHNNSHHFEIFIDARKFELEESSMTGAGLKALASIDPSYQLFLEKEGNEDDEPINDTQAVAIRSGLHFFAIPATTFGQTQTNQF